MIAVFCLSEAFLIAYLSHKGNLLRTFISFNFIMEIVNNFPFIITIFYFPSRNIFIPSFLNCWLAKNTLENMFKNLKKLEKRQKIKDTFLLLCNVLNLQNDVNKALQKSQSALSQRLTILVSTLICLIFTSER
ncbi:hypothetical protein B4U80_04150 [Leptotrombidium deliense]|uniref:Uncharacterized protein n=1 Tax=Leptotrombidium deliense TaxID=299467 RepID=A0A443SFK3_9ACAR|nr:hypothetical protein B4U80_04150 [Leptotrombidium deliense]